jgi:hypothetical protein
MWTEDVIVPLGFFGTVIILSIGIPLVRALARKWERQPTRLPMPAEVEQRLARIEHAVDAIAIEVERISEGQRFTTKLFADRAAEPVRIAQSTNSRSGGNDAR